MDRKNEEPRGNVLSWPFTVQFLIKGFDELFKSW